MPNRNWGGVVGIWRFGRLMTAKNTRTIHISVFFGPDGVQRGHQIAFPVAGELVVVGQVLIFQDYVVGLLRLGRDHEARELAKESSRPPLSI